MKDSERLILENDARLRKEGKIISLRQQLNAIIYDLVQPFDAKQATAEQVAARDFLFRRLDVLLGRDPNASAYTVPISRESSESVRPYECRPPPFEILL